MRQMAGRAAVVIGGGGGVGRGICHGLADAGMSVLLADLDDEAASRAVAEIQHASPGAALVAATTDATDEAAMARLRRRTLETFGRVDVVAIAVGAILQRPLEQVTLAEWGWLWNLNVLSQISAVNTFLPDIRQQDEGHVLLTAAGAGLHAVQRGSDLGAYGVVKHALVGYAKNLRRELEQDRIGVTLLCPTAIAGRLDETSAMSHRLAVGPNRQSVGGKQPADRTLDEGRALGPIVVDAVSRDDFLASNRPDELADAIEEDRAFYFGAR